MSESIYRWTPPGAGWQIKRCLLIVGAADTPPLSRWQQIWRGLQQSFRLMVGVHDYQTYLKHMRLHHPETTPMDERTFHRHCLNARFPSQAGNPGRCPC